MKRYKQPMLPFGTLPHKLHRAGAPDTSVAAAYSVDTTKLERLVYDTIARSPGGATQDDVLAAHPSRAYSSITARFRALLDKGLIRDTGARRLGRHGRPQRIVTITTPPR